MSELPTGWLEVELGEVFPGTRRSSIVPAKEPDRRFDLYSVPSFETGVPERLYGSEIGSSKQEVVPGSVLLCRINPRINRVWVVGEAGTDPQIASTEWVSLPRVPGMAPRFAMQALRTPKVRRYLTSSVSGVGGSLMRVRMDALWRTKIPLAPLPEQHRIVAKIESLLAILDEGVAALKRAETNRERYRASVLKAAVEGRLTEQWRRENPPEETGEELLQRILAERRKRWEAEQLAKFEAKGRKPPRNWRAKYKEPVAPDTSGLPGLPEGWCWVTLPQLGDFGRGKSKHRPRGDAILYGGDFPFIQTGEVARASGWIRYHSKTYNHLGLSQSRLWPQGTLCITIAANIAETGILAYPACFPDSIVGLVTGRPTLTQFLDYFMRTARSDLTRYAPATAQKNINLTTLSKLAVPLPPTVEQERIVRLLERLVTVQEATVGTVTKTYGLGAQHLRNSILKRAFEGRLVPQDPADEPASVLLERIRAERAAARKRRKRRPNQRKRQPKSQIG